MLVAKLASITSWKFVFRTFTRHTTTLSLPFRVRYEKRKKEIRNKKK